MLSTTYPQAFSAPHWREFIKSNGHAQWIWLLRRKGFRQGNIFSCARALLLDNLAVADEIRLFGIDIGNGGDRVDEENIPTFKEMEEPRARLPEEEKKQIRQSGNQEETPEGEEETRRIKVIVLCDCD